MADTGIRTPNLPLNPLVEVIGHADAGGGQPGTVSRQKIQDFVQSLLAYAGLDPSGVADLANAIQAEVARAQGAEEDLGDRIDGQGGAISTLQTVVSPTGLSLGAGGRLTWDRLGIYGFANTLYVPRNWYLTRGSTIASGIGGSASAGLATHTQFTVDPSLPVTIYLDLDAGGGTYFAVTWPQKLPTGRNDRIIFVAAVLGERVATLHEVATPAGAVDVSSDSRWLLAFRDPAGKVIAGFDRTSGWWTPGRPQPAMFPGVLHAIFLGQSNNQGGEANPVVSSADLLHGNLMFQRGYLTRSIYDGTAAVPNLRPPEDFELVPLVAAISEDLLSGEGAAVGFASQFKLGAVGGRFAPSLKLNDAAPHVLCSYPHQGGKFLIELAYTDYETDPANTATPGPGGYQATFRDDISRAKAAAAAAGLDYGVGAFILCQGENEGGGVMKPGGALLAYSDFMSQYTTLLLNAINAWATDAANLTGQIRPVPFLIRQCANDVAGQAQALVAASNAHVFMTGPNWYAPNGANSLYNGQTHGNSIHRTADGNRWLGEMDAKVLRRIYAGEDWEPLKAVDAYRVTDTTIRVRFNVPRKPLQFDRVNFPPVANEGFLVWSGTRSARGTSKQISGVTIISDDTIEIALTGGATVTAGSQAFVSCGDVSIFKGTSGPIESIAAGTSYTLNGVAIPSTEICYTGDISADFTQMLREGCFAVQDLTNNGYAIIRDLRVANGKTYLRGETREFTGTFTTGQATYISRLIAFSTLMDSDNTMSIYRFTDPSYGTRQNQYYPLNNRPIFFNIAVRT